MQYKKSIEQLLQEKIEVQNFRILHSIESIRTNSLIHSGRFVNLSSNDYLGIAADDNLRTEFLADLSPDKITFSSSSSRLQSGNSPEYTLLEHDLANAFSRDAALVFNSGYHLNSGIIPAIAGKDTLILADKLVHASIIDGIKLSDANCIRYRHLDYAQLERLIDQNASSYATLLIVTESIFSMDGDETDLQRLVSLKRKYDNILIYLDEAHSFGIRGKKGLGCCEEQSLIQEVDFITGTFGKALGSLGAFIICDTTTRDYLINTVRPFIFTTALPPLNIAWTRFIFNRMMEFDQKRCHLKCISQDLRSYIEDKKLRTIAGQSQIIPIIIGDNQTTVSLAEQLQRKGFFVLPIRPPTVPVGTSRLRLSLHASMTKNDIDELACLLDLFL